MILKAFPGRVGVIFVLGLVALTAIVLAGQGPAQTLSHRATSQDWTVTISVAHTTAKAGTTIPATFSIDNKTGHRIQVSGCAGQEYELVLGNDTIHNFPLMPADLCGGWMGPGIHVVHATVSTSYESCGGNGVPRCGNPPRLSALPAGTYRTQILLPVASPSLPQPQPLTIVLTN